MVSPFKCFSMCVCESFIKNCVQPGLVYTTTTCRLVLTFGSFYSFFYDCKLTPNQGSTWFWILPRFHFLWGPSGFLKLSNYLLTQRLYICDASPWLLNRFTNSSCFAYSIFELSFDAKVLMGFTMLLVTKQFKQRSRFFYGILPFSFSLAFLFLSLFSFFFFLLLHLPKVSSQPWLWKGIK